MGKQIFLEELLFTYRTSNIASCNFSFSRAAACDDFFALASLVLHSDNIRADLSTDPSICNTSDRDELGME